MVRGKIWWWEKDAVGKNMKWGKLCSGEKYNLGKNNDVGKTIKWEKLWSGKKHEVRKTKRWEKLWRRKIWCAIMIWSTLSLADKEICKIHDLTYDLMRVV